MEQTKRSVLKMNIVFGGVSLNQRAQLAKSLSVMLASGLPISEALHVAEDTATGKLKHIVGKVARSVETGNSLSGSLQPFSKVFSSLFISAVYAGEKSGTLEENLIHVASQLEKEKELVSKIKTAMLYPIVVLITACVLGLGLSYMVLPKITLLFAGLNAELPFTTRVLIRFSHILETSGWFLIPAIILGIVFIVLLLRAKFLQPFTHGAILHIPIVKQVSRNANIARFSRTLRTLLKSGVSIEEALEITGAATKNYYYRNAIAALGERIVGGEKFSESFADFQSLFPLLVVSLVRVGEESGRLVETLEYLAHFYDVEVDTATKSLSTALEPLLLLIIGAIVGFLALSIITPIYEITGTVHR